MTTDMFPPAPDDPEPEDENRRRLLEQLLGQPSEEYDWENFSPDFDDPIFTGGENLDLTTGELIDVVNPTSENWENPELEELPPNIQNDSALNKLLKATDTPDDDFDVSYIQEAKARARLRRMQQTNPEFFGYTEPPPKKPELDAWGYKPSNEEILRWLKWKEDNAPSPPDILNDSSLNKLLKAVTDIPDDDEENRKKLDEEMIRQYLKDKAMTEKLDQMSSREEQEAFMDAILEDEDYKSDAGTMDYSDVGALFEYRYGSGGQEAQRQAGFRGDVPVRLEGGYSEDPTTRDVMDMRTDSERWKGMEPPKELPSNIQNDSAVSKLLKLSKGVQFVNEKGESGILGGGTIMEQEYEERQKAMKASAQKALKAQEAEENRKKQTALGNFNRYMTKAEMEEEVEFAVPDPSAWTTDTGLIGSQPASWEKPDLSGATVPQYWVRNPWASPEEEALGETSDDWFYSTGTGTRDPLRTFKLPHSGSPSVRMGQ